MNTTEMIDLTNVKAQAYHNGQTLTYFGTIADNPNEDIIAFMANIVRQVNGDNIPCKWEHERNLHHFYVNLPRIIDRTNGGLDEAIQHSLRTADWTLFHTLLREAFVSHWNDSTTTLMPDFAPYSMMFKRVANDGAMWMMGGLIYHAPNDFGAGAPTFCVRMERGSGWAIHT